MAWPPPVLPTNRTNATPQQDTHPADHNAVNLAVNDTVAQVQGILSQLSSTGPGGFGNVGYIKYGQMVGGTAGPGGNVKIARSLILPAGIWAVCYSVLLSSDNALIANCRIYNVASGFFDMHCRQPAPTGTGTYTAVVPSVGGGEVSVDLMPQAGAGNVSAFSDNSNHSLFAIGLRQ